MSETRKPMLTGGCQCGHVRYALYARPDAVNICHCRMCQKAVGGPFAAFASVAAADFAWTRGSPGAFQSSSIAARDHCRDCGTPLTFRYLDQPRISVTTGSLDHPEAAVPDEQFGIENRLAWLDRLDTMPATRTEDDDPTGRLVGMVNHQHPDGETPQG